MGSDTNTIMVSDTIYNQNEIMGVRHHISLLVKPFRSKNGPKAVDLLQLQPPFDPLKSTDYPIKTYRQVSVCSLDIRYLIA